MPVKKTVDLNDLLKREAPIYVRNSSGNDAVTLVVVTVGNKQEGIKIPAQRVPWRIDHLYGHKAISESQELRGLLARGVLEIVSEAEANKLLANPNIARQVQLLNQRRGVGSARKDVKPASDMINSRVMSIMASVTSIGTLEAQQAAIDDLDLVSNTTVSDIGYVFQNSVNLRTVNEWASKRLAQLRSEDYEDDGEPEEVQVHEPRRAVKPAKPKAAPAPAPKKAKKSAVDDGVKDRFAAMAARRLAPRTN